MLAERIRPSGVVCPSPGHLAVAVVGLAWFLSGCGSGSRPPAMSVVPASLAPPTSVGTTILEEASPTEGAGVSSELPSGTAAGAAGPWLGDWVAPSADISAVFLAEAARVDCPVYVPSRVPPGSVVVGAGDEGVLGLSDAGAESVIRLTTGFGSIEIAQGIAGDVGDLPGEQCGEVAGRPAIVYRMLGGHLVQWSDPPWWYGIFSQTVSREELISFAGGMTRAEYPADH